MCSSTTEEVEGMQGAAMSGVWLEQAAQEV